MQLFVAFDTLFCLSRTTVLLHGRLEALAHYVINVDNSASGQRCLMCRRSTQQLVAGGVEYVYIINQIILYNFFFE